MLRRLRASTSMSSGHRDPRHRPQRSNREPAAGSSLSGSPGTGVGTGRRYQKMPAWSDQPSGTRQTDMNDDTSTKAARRRETAGRTPHVPGTNLC